MAGKKSAFLSFYFFYFGFQAVIIGFFPVYAKSIGFDSLEIALIALAHSFAVIIAPPVVTSYAYHLGGAKRVVVLCSAGAFLFFLPLYFGTSFLFVILFWFASLLCSRSFMPFVDFTAIKADFENKESFGHKRLWGSVGFVLITFILGYFTKHFGSGYVLHISACILFLLFLMVVRVSRYVEEDAPDDGHLLTKRFAALFFSKNFAKARTLLLAYSLVWTSCGSWYAFFSVHLLDLGYSESFVAFAWSVGVAAEILMFMLFYRVEKYISLAKIIILCAFATTLRWVLMSFAVSEVLILFAQTFHAFTFAGLFVAGAKLLYEVSPRGVKSKGPALLASLGSGGGSVLGKFIIAVLILLLPPEGLYFNLFIVSAVISFAALLVSLKLVRMKE